MKVYLARHGQTVLNVARKYQDGSDELNETGKKQVRLLAGRLVNIGFDKVISSSQKRAISTANIISEKLDCDYETSDMLVEIKHPTELVGRDYEDKEAQVIRNKIRENFSDSEFRYSDEENFSDLKKRGEAALEYIAGFAPETERLLVVGHGGFMRVIGGLKIFGPDMTSKQYGSLWQASINNTGLNIYDYDPKTYRYSWKLISWNDHSHLEGTDLITNFKIKNQL